MLSTNDTSFSCYILAFICSPNIYIYIYIYIYMEHTHTHTHTHTHIYLSIYIYIVPTSSPWCSDSWWITKYYFQPIIHTPWFLLGHYTLALLYLAVKVGLCLAFQYLKPIPLTVSDISVTDINSSFRPFIFYLLGCPFSICKVYRFKSFARHFDVFPGQPICFLFMIFLFLWNLRQFFYCVSMEQPIILDIFRENFPSWMSIILPVISSEISLIGTML